MWANRAPGPCSCLRRGAVEALTAARGANPGEQEMAPGSSQKGGCREIAPAPPTVMATAGRAGRPVL